MDTALYIARKRCFLDIGKTLAAWPRHEHLLVSAARRQAANPWHIEKTRLHGTSVGWRSLTAQAVTGCDATPTARAGLKQGEAPRE